MLIFKSILISTLILSVHAQCRQSSDSFIGDLCYSFPITQLNFTDARNYCRSINQNLAVIHDKNQNQFLATLVRTYFSSSIALFWIGLSRSSLNSPFVWDDGTPMTWSNFGNVAKDGLYVAESTVNGKWETPDGHRELNFVCSYPSSSKPIYSTMPARQTTIELVYSTSPAMQTTIGPKPSVTCLFMVDMQSAGINQAAIDTYNTYYNFALLVGSKLNDASFFTGYIDTFGYSGILVDHQSYPADSYFDFSNIPFPIDGTDDDDIDLDLKDVDASLTTATWEPSSNDQTCMIFFSAAPEALYGGTTIKTTYDSFTTVLGVLIGDATFIPGLANVILASTLSDADASAVVQKLLESLQ